MNAGSTTIRGTVQLFNGNHIHNAKVSIMDFDIPRTVFTNKAGNFKLSNLDLDNCMLRVTADNCLPAEFAVALQRSRTNIFNITMVRVPVPQQPSIVNAPQATIQSVSTN